MCLQNYVFSMHLGKFVLVFLDGILIYSKNEEEHVEHLRLTLNFLKKHKLYVGLSNYDFYEDGIHYLGHIISDKGISVDPEKIEAMMSWPAPRKLKELRYFVEISGCCKRFTEGYSTGKDESMYKLTKPARELVDP